MRHSARQKKAETGSLMDMSVLSSSRVVLRMSTAENVQCCCLSLSCRQIVGTRLWQSKSVSVRLYNHRSELIRVSSASEMLSFLFEHFPSFLPSFVLSISTAGVNPAQPLRAHAPGAHCVVGGVGAAQRAQQAHRRGERVLPNGHQQRSQEPLRLAGEFDRYWY